MFLFVYGFLFRPRGLWQPLSGQIRLNRRMVGPRGGVFFLPQRPFFTNGSLREQVFYPLVPGAAGPNPADDEQILVLFRRADMSGIGKICIKK